MKPKLPRVISVVVCLSVFLCGGLATRALAADTPVKLPVPQLETLPNGLRVAWFVSDSLPVVDLALMVQSGSRDDLPGKSGTAELLAAVLDRGASGMSAQQIASAVEALGATRYASADQDTFSVAMHGLAPDAPALLELMAKVALHPDLPQVEVNREHARLVDRWSHIPDYGDTLVSLAYQRMLTAGTHYGRGGFASAREFSNVSKTELQAFHRTHFTPKNSVLMVVGRVNPSEFKQKILKAFGTPEVWSGEVPRRAWRAYGERLLQRKGAIYLVDRPKLSQTQVRIGFPAPLVKSPDHYSLTVANALLGEYFNSRLNSLIRDKLGLTYGISSSFAYNRDFASFTITSATRNQSVGQLIKRTLEVLKDLKHSPLPSDEVKQAKEYLAGSFPLGTSTLGAVASRWLAGYIYDLGPEYLNEFIPKVEAVSTEQVLGAISRHFNLDQLVIAVAGDAAEIQKSLDQEQQGSIVRIDLKQLM